MKFFRRIISELHTWKQKKHSKPLIVNGARQIGKTWVLKRFGEQNFNTVHYIDFEKSSEIKDIFQETIDPKKILSNYSLLAKKNINIEEDLFILDEIQAAPKALTSLKYFAEEYPQLKICAAGSLLGVGLSDESAPVGKVEVINMFPLDFEEYVDACGEKEIFLEYTKQRSNALFQHLLRRFREYLIVGGLPEAITTFLGNNSSPEKYQDAFNAVRKIQQNIINLYMLDMAKHSGKANAIHIEKIFTSIPNKLSRNIDEKTTRFRVKDLIEGISSFNRLESAFDWLTKAGLVYKSFIIDKVVSPLSNQSKENIFKLFCFDTGILNCLADLPPNSVIRWTLTGFQGAILENFVAQELKAAGIKSLYTWTGAQSEVDFVVEGREHPNALEVKSGAKLHSKSLDVLESKFSPVTATILGLMNISEVDIKYNYEAAFLVKEIINKR